MRAKIGLAVLASIAASGCAHKTYDLPDQGLAPVNVPVVSRTSFVFDAAAPGGYLAPAEAARLDAWLQTMRLGYGDTIQVDGPYAQSARGDIDRIAGNYGILVAQGAPVTAGAVPADTVRVIVTRSVASVPNCPNWDRQSQPNYNNQSMPNLGCAVNSNLAAMVANPEDLIHGRDSGAVSDGSTGAKAVTMYRNWPLTGVAEGQQKRPLPDNNTKKDD